MSILTSPAGITNLRFFFRATGRLACVATALTLLAQFAAADDLGRVYLPWGDFESGTPNYVGRVVEGGSWDGSAAVEVAEAYPWFTLSLRGTPEREAVWKELRGRWCKIYFDTLGGDFGVVFRDEASGEWGWLKGANRFRTTSTNYWVRHAGTFQVPDKDYERPEFLVYYFHGDKPSSLFDNFRLYLVGSEPEELLEPFTGAKNPNVKSILPDVSFESSLPGAVPPAGWSLLAGGARVLVEGAHTGEKVVELHADSRLATPPLEAEKGVPVRLSFWVRGRGILTVVNTDLDSVGIPLKRGSDLPGVPIIRNFSVPAQWAKIELQSYSFSPLTAKCRIELVTGPDSEVYVDDFTVERDIAMFPLPPVRKNPFKGSFTSRNAQLEVTFGGGALHETDAITGPAALVIRATPTGKGSPGVTGGLRFEEGGVVNADPHWRWTTAPVTGADALSYDDSQWRRVEFDGKRMTPDETIDAGPVWFRRVVIWNVPRMLAPDVWRLPIAKGFIQCLVYSLNPPTPTAPRSYELVVGVPGEIKVLPIEGRGAYFMPSRVADEGDQGGRHRYRLVHQAEHIQGAAGSAAGIGARSSAVLLELQDDLPRNAKVQLGRVYNGNQVELPIEVPLVQVPEPDGTHPRDILFHSWNLPYVYANAPAPTFDVETVERIMKLYAHAGITDSPWQAVNARPGHRPDNYALDPERGGKWAGWLRDHGAVVHPVWHVWPLSTTQGTPTYELLKKHPEAVAGWSEQLMPGTDEPETCSISTGWVLSDRSDEYWAALRSEYAWLVAEVKRLWGLEVRRIAWDYEFETNSSAGGYDPLTLDLFRTWAGLPADTPLDKKIIATSYSGQYHNFSRETCRRLIQETRERVLDPLGLEFHVYYGEGRPFDPGNCPIISAWGVGQNVATLIPSVEVEYIQMSRGFERAPDVRFLSIMQPEQLSNMVRRQMDYQEFAANIIKRTIAVRGGGHSFFYGIRPFAPGMYYGMAEAARFLAKWEDYFKDFDPLFAGEALDQVVTIDPAPPDVSLLRKGNKGLLLVFADAHERQPEPVRFKVKPRQGKATVLHLGPAEVGAVELVVETSEP